MNNIIHSFDEKKSNNDIAYSYFFIFVAFTVILGVVSGFLASKINKKTVNNTSSSSQKKEKVVGIADKKIFKDQAEGILKEGGIDGEGNFHLERPGGPSQNVYLTSSTVDLSLYIGKKVRVWGETFSAQKAGWLMDVGLVEILEK
ncbi:MAG: hypothetical protein NZM02_02325 [Patescibacteria group bacterium]|nr:hypothetical protein [Patescibacteria group bacterium]